MIGEKIQQLRKTHQLSQEQLAEKLLVSRQAISKWELGETVPETDKIVLISQLLSVSTDYLLKDEDVQNAKSKKENLSYDNRGVFKNLGPTSLVSIMTGVSVIGLLVSIIIENIFWYYSGVFLIGTIIQIMGLIGFEIFLHQRPERSMIKTRRWFYLINIWLILPFYSLVVSKYVFYVLRWDGYDVLYGWMVRGITYVVMGIIVSIILLIVLKKPKKTTD